MSKREQILCRLRVVVLFGFSSSFGNIDKLVTVSGTEVAAAAAAAEFAGK